MQEPPTPEDYAWIDEIHAFGDDVPVLYIGYNIEDEEADREASRYESDFYKMGDAY